MPSSAQVQLAPVTQDEAFRRFENQENGSTLMEEPQPVVDVEAELFRAEVAAELLEGHAAGIAEANADRLLKRLGMEAERITRIENAARLEITLIRDHAEAQKAKVGRRVDYLRGLIRAQLPGDGSRFKALYGGKSLSLAHGRIGWKQHQAGIDVADPVKALAYAKAHNLPVKVEESVGKTALKEHVVRTGEEPDPDTDGFAFVPARDEFFCAPELPF